MKNKENSVGSVSRDYVVGITIICTIEYIKQTKSDIEISRITMADFLSQNTKIQFGLDFSSVSVSSLIEE